MGQSIDYTLVGLPETERPQTPARTAGGTTRGMNAIVFGRGAVTPFVRDGQGDWANADDIRVVRADVAQVLGTLASSGSTDGELPWRPEFGSVLQLIRFRNLDETTVELARTYVVDALKNWLFRVQVKDTSIEIDRAQSLLVIHVFYDILAANRRSVVAAGLTATAAVPVAA